MDYSNRQYLQQQSQTVPRGIDPYAQLYNAQQPYNTYTFSHYSTNLNPRPHATDNVLIQYEHIGATCSIYSQPKTTAYEPQIGLVTSCYRDPIGTNRRTNEEFGGYNANPVIYGTAGIQTTARPVQLEPPTLNPISNHWQYKIGKNTSKKTKIVQSAWCETCKIQCTSKEVLDQHKLGKKHKKNLDKLMGSNKNTSAPSTEIKPLNTNQVNLTKETRKKTTANSRKRVSEDENLETKKQKLMDGGASPGSVRVCAICNVVVNSELVFSYHLAGQKHAAQVKKHAAQETGSTELPSSDKAA